MPNPVLADSGYRVVMGTFSRVVVIARTERTARAALQAALSPYFFPALAPFFAP